MLGQDMKGMSAITSKAAGLWRSPGVSNALLAVGEVSIAIVTATVFWAAFARLTVTSGSTDVPPVDRDTCRCNCWDGLYKNGLLLLIIYENSQ